MEADYEHELRMAALSRRLRHLWPKRKTAVVDDYITEENLRNGEKIAFGRLHGSQDVNFQAFQTTMKKAWKCENVTCTQFLPGLFQFEFPTIEEKLRILESGPWSFTRHVLVLRPWEPGVLPQCIKFDSYAFWMHIHGLPVEGRTEEVIRNIAGKLGEVLDVKVEARGFSALTVGKAKVILDLSCPLESGMIYSFKGKEHWLDFRYERLPVYCFSCGRLGHYAQKCKEIPYDEEFLSNDDNLLYGSWLKAEFNTFSPFWKSFYEPPLEVQTDVESAPENPEILEQHETLEIVANDPLEERGKRKMTDIIGMR
ncbi:uncharacterized protein At4g02000-like [Rhodamnia argentea]|uniref:Uncharacterized protein At4g02000-like n=1 Tax=Rhodamnia argentea TaxID=178133 RepID=A0ABM3GXH0_9MYRT|nr:uncharacterized protein At4g02000-like [Rhodamnia argentea]